MHMCNPDAHTYLLLVTRSTVYFTQRGKRLADGGGRCIRSTVTVLMGRPECGTGHGLGGSGGTVDVRACRFGDR